MAAMTVTDIPVSDIDLSDTGFRITGPAHDMAHLRASISRYGIMNMPLVMCRQDKYIVVSGFRRIESARDAGLSRITCRVLPPGDPLDAAMAAVTENAFSRELTPAELIRAIVLLLGFMDARHISEKATAIFNMPLNAGYINTLASIHAMPGPGLDLLDQGRISIKACKRLVSMDADTMAGFLDIFAGIKVSSGIQMEIIAWANEICALEKISLSRLIRESPLGAGNGDEPGQGGSSSGHRDMAARGKQFKAFLARRRFPVLTAAKTQALEKIRALELGAGLQLDIPENFEGMVFTVQMAFKNLDEYKTILDRLAELPGHSEFQSLVDRCV